MYLLFKNNIHISTAYSEKEAEELYLKYGCDDIIEYEYIEDLMDSELIDNHD